MKKRICSIFTTLMILLVCVFAGACGNKYENMEFKVLYAFSEDAEIWNDGTDGITLNYGEDIDGNDNGPLVFNEQGVAQIFVKVEVKNVKAKHIDSITVSFGSLTGLNFSPKRVKEGKVFSIDVTGNVTTVMKLYENNSGKKSELSFVISRRLKSITADADLMPALAVNGSLNLLALNNLTYEPLHLTNQIGVKYSIDSIGGYDAGHVYVPVIAQGQAQTSYVDMEKLENGILSFKNTDFFAANAYVVRIKATSIFHDGVESPDVISAVFDVYVVDDEISAPLVKFVNSEGKQISEQQNYQVNLYDNGGETYSKSTLFMDQASLVEDENKYVNGLFSSKADLDLRVTTAIYVLNSRNEYEKYEFGEDEYQSGINGLVIDNCLTNQNIGDENTFIFSILNRETPKNRVKVVSEIKGLDFSCSQNVSEEFEFEVIKGVLPTRITINDAVDLENGNTASAVVYGTAYEGYNGLELKISANPNDNPQRKMLIAPDAGLLVSDAGGHPVNDYIVTGGKIFVKFKDGVSDEQDLTIKTLNVPEYYNGEEIVVFDDSDYLTITYKINKLVTADAFEFISDGKTDEHIVEDDKKLILNAEHESNIYVRVYHSGLLDLSTIKLESNNDSILFGNGLKNINLSDANVAKYGETKYNEDINSDYFGMRYSIYRIPVLASNKKVDANIKISAGNGEIGLDESVNVSSVYLMSDTALSNLNVDAVSGNVKEFEDVDNGAFNFAVNRGEFAEFSVVDGNGKTNTIEKLSLTAVEIPEVLPEDNFSSQAVSYNIISNSVFVAMGRISGKTQVLNLVIEYYEYDEDSDVILLLNSNPKQIQIAVYDAISNVSASSTKDKIGFVNEYYKETAEAIITYNAKNANAGSPAKEVVFRSGDDNIKKTGASDVKVVLNNNVNLGNYAGKIKIEYETGTGYEELRFGENLGNISGNIKITLSGEVTGLNEISLTIIGVRFGMDTNIVANISIKVVRVEKAQSIVISGDNFVNVDGNNEIQLSFMNVGDGGYDEKDFSAELTFNLSGKDDYLYFSDIGTALTHLLYKYEQDASGRWVLHRISDDFLRISYADGKVSVRAYKNNGGGLFKLVLATKDSYIHDEDPNAIILTEEYFDLKQSIDIRVSDGVEIAYPIWDIDDLYKINNNLSSKFALCTNLDLRGDEFIPLGFDGTRMNAFKGTLTGKPEKLEIKYSISLMLKTPQRSDEGNVLGLFGILDEGACVENLKVNASFAENGYDNVLARGLKVGSVAAVNFGRIENVDVTIISPSTIKFGSDGVGTIDFGGIVGLNSNTGSVLSSRIECSSCIAIETSVPKTHNIGLIAGTNNGTIQGKYNSKENLNGFVYDVIANINVKANTNGGGFNVNLGAVGCNTANVKNVLVGGKIVAEQGGSNLLEGYIGGIVGHSNGGTVSTVVALGLDIDSTNSNMYSVGGIVGKASENAKVDYAKFVSVIIKNLASIGDTHGQINAKGNVAGIIAQADSGVEIIYSSVESFIDQIYDAGVGDFKTFETLISENNVAGIALGNAKINQSFVNANMYAGTSDTIGNAYLIGNSEASCSNNYFIGKVEKGTKHNNNTTYVIDISEFSIVDFDTTYMESVAVDEKTSVWDNIYIDNRDGTYTKANTYDNTKTYKKFKATAWKSYAESLVSSWDNAIWAIQQNYNVIKYNGVSLFFPYLLRAYNNGTEDVSEILMIVAPEEMSSSINTDYVLDTNSIWIKEFDYDKYNIVESVIVNYLNAATEEDNSHNVLNTSEIDGEPNGLIDLTFLPNNAQGGWAFDILGPGRRFAYINSEKKIVFTSASGSTPILVRIYSVFNPEIETYVLIYTQCLYEDLQLSSSALYATTNSDYKYEMNLYTGQENNVISFKADNGKGDNGENNSTIFDVYGLKQYIKVEVVSDKVDSKLSIGESPAYNNMSLSIKKNDFTANYYETVEFRLYLLKKYFNVVDVDDEILNGVEAILLDTIKVKVNFFNAAHSIVVNGEDAEISTHEDISFEVYLYSEFIDEDSTRVVKSHYVNEYGEILLNEGEPTDSIKIKFDYDENDAQIIELMSTNNVNHFAQLFDLTIVREVFERNKKGYYYSINLELINDRNYRYITSAVQYDIIVYATSNPTVNTETDPMNVVLKPTSVSTARIENYTVNKINVNTDYTDIVKCSDLQTSIVEPGSLGNVMIIYLEPAYSNVVSATIKSSSLFVPSKGKDVTMRFSQLVLDERGGTYKYTTLYGGHNSQVGDTLALNTISKIDADGNRLYTGIIYVYIQLEEFAGLEDTMTVELNVETNDGKQITRTRDLLTKYMPGVDIQYDNSKKVAGGYLIQQGTSNNEFKVKIYGYQFNKNPRVRFEWNISEADSDYSIVDKDNKDTISDGTKNYLTGDYVSYIWNKNYDEIEHNLDDDSYTITLNLNVDPKIMASFKMIIDFDLTTKDGQIEEKSAEIVLYPTDYILTGVNVTGLHGGRKNILINKSSAVEFGFTTDNDVNDLSDELYEKLLTYAEADENGLKYGLTSKFAYYQNGGWISFAEENKHPEFELNLVNEKLLTILGVSKFTNLVEFKIWYGYTANNNGVYSFGFGQAGDITSSKSCSFTLNIVPPDEILEIPIYSADELYNPASQTWHLEENVHYILMNDIVLENVVPITTPIAQFDGNNRVISIKSFAVNPANTEFGLFGKVGTYTIEDLETEEEIIKQTIIKNVIVDYSKFEGTLALNHCTTKELVFGGLIAVNDGGLIYNCDVMNLANGTDAQVDVIVAGDADITFGGLVGINKGIITNSRVGRNSYIKITATKTIESYVERKAGGLTFSIYNTKYEESNVNQFKVVAGGFVGQNVNTISTSYVEKTNLINYSTNETTNLTAGFVGENSGTILSSYSKADDATITITNPRAKGYVVENKGNGIVSGFVYNNLGTITDAYANIELATKSAYISGFVYNNTGKISEAYSACIMNAGGVDNNAEQPFIGVDNAGNLLSNGVIENCYYLMRSNVDNPYYQGDKDVALGLNEENIQDSAHLIGFAFVLSNLKDEREQGIWSYYTTSSKKRMLPELMNANMVAHSYRYVIDPEAPEVKFDYAKAYAPGTVNNPYTISNVEEYNDVFTEHGQSLNGQKGYVRFINNINFNNDETAIKTRTNYTLGSESLSERTSVEGNGLTISGIYFDAGEEIVKEIGLFAHIENAYIKNLNLEFATPTTDGQFSTQTAMYSGGLAGSMNNSVVLNVSLKGNNTTLTGRNFVGGVAGYVSGNSLIYGIETNLNIKAIGSTNNLYYNETDYKKLNIKSYSGIEDYASYINTLSYAGGVAGVLDLTSRKNVEHNIQYIDIHGDQMNEKIFNGEVEANILGEYAGGVAGYANENTSSYRLRYFTGEKEYIEGKTAVGGLFGAYMGKIVASQVTTEEDTQYTYDTIIGEYVLSITDLDDASKETLNTEEIGNLKLLKSYGYAGGLIGLGLKSSISSCYAKAGFAAGKHIGGLIGLSVSSDINYSYAIPYINSYAEMSYVGGLIGSAYGINNKIPERNYEISAYEALLRYKGNSNVNTSIIFTYSTIIFDLNTFVKPANAVIDFISANYKDSENVYLQSGAAKSFVHVYSGTIRHIENIVSNQTLETNNCSKMQLFRLFNVGDPDQTVSFQEVFGGWEITQYWLLKEEKYFPLLTHEPINNYINIDDQYDLEIVKNNPTGKYRVVNSFEINANSLLNNNWIIESTFKGIMIGEIEGSSYRPAITIKGLKPNRSDESAGFFKETENATISNIEFVWAPINMVDVDNLTMVSGLTCKDTESLITNVEVRTSYTIGDATTGYFINETGNSINGFAGIVGVGDNTNVLDCKFIGKVNALLSGEQEIFVGGIAAQMTTKPDLEGTAVVNNSTIGARAISETGYNETIAYSTTQFNFTIQDNGNAVYIGGILGKGTNAGVSACSMGSTEYTEGYQFIGMNITINEEQYVYIGGAVGYAEEGLISKVQVLTNIKLLGAVPEGNPEINIAGLAGTYVANKSLTTGIKNCSVNATIVTDASFIVSNTTNVILSTGVANLAATMQQCLFTGEINTEASTDITIIYAGGAVARVTTSSEIEEVITNTAIIVGTSKTATIYVGGLVGWASGNVKTSYSASWGRIVPITKGDAADLNIFVGGLIGKINQVVAINNSYTISSILTDSIATAAITELNVGALFGGLNEGANLSDVTTEAVYYSSDFALCADENYVGDSPMGINMSAQSMIMSEVWQRGLKTEGGVSNAIWTTLMVGGNYRMPHLYSLEEDLKKFDLINPLSEDYKTGTAMNPKKIYGTDSQVSFSSDYTYYLLLMSGTESKITATFTSELKGIVLGQEAEFTVESISNTVDSNYGIIPVVGKHSAISNLHIRMLPSVTMAYGGGVIAGCNNGVIFNSSVQGSGVTITAGADIGLIAAVNKGMVSHCYSTAEIIESSINIGGIVHTNGGKLLSNYFTGYINSTGAAAGIMFAVDGSSNYAFNNYMGGVISCEGAMSNKFAASATSFEGSNNYIDKYVDLNYNSTETNLIAVSTSTLMSEGILKGKWYYNVENKKIKALELTDDPTDEPSAKNYVPTFGRNYNYPVYRFNKYVSKTSEEMEINDWKYQLFTGTGELYTSGEFTHEERYDLLMSDENENLNNYFYALKIPHLGILTSVQAYLAEDRNYVIIYDLDGKYGTEGASKLEWKAIGAEGDVDGFAASEFGDGEVSFNGVVITNKHYNLTKINTEEPTSHMCNITNLSGVGLFTNIKDAYFADFSLGSFNADSTLDSSSETIKTAGVLAHIVIGNLYTNNIYYVRDGDNPSVITGVGHYSGLVGLNKGDLSVKRFVSSHGTDVATSLKLQGNQDAVVGLIAAVSSGKITLNGAVNTDSSYLAWFDGNGYAGGIVGEMTGGSINGNNYTININKTKVTDEDGITNVMGGVVGKVSGSGAAAVAEAGAGAENFGLFNIRVNLHGAQDDIIEVNANNFGGVVGELSAPLTITSSLVIKISGAEIKFKYDNDVNSGRYFGLLAAYQTDNAATVTTTNLTLETATEGGLFKVSFENKNADGGNYDDTVKTCGVGTFLGKQSADLTIGEYSGSQILLSAKGAPNLGGISGFYTGGMVNIQNAADLLGGKPFILVGETNVGGLFGYCNVEITQEIFKDGINFFNTTNRTEGQQFATIIVDGSATETHQNFGGLIGNWAVEVEDGGAKPTDAEETETETENKIVNYNQILIAYNNGEYTYDPSESEFTATVLKDSDGAAYNVGGIAGKIENVNVENMENRGKIKPFEASKVFKVVDENVVLIKSSADHDDGIIINNGKAINVGGVVGLLLNEKDLKNINNIYNYKEVYGYQNVGGLIGYAKGKIAISNDKAIIIEEGLSSKDFNDSLLPTIAGCLQDNYALKGNIAGSINVGGAVGYAGEEVSISKVYSKSNVIGVTNVGGLVGASQKASLTLNYVQGTDDLKAGTIRGVYYYHKFEINGGKEEKEEYAIPTSIGGLIGYSEDCIIGAVKEAIFMPNVVDNVKIRTATESETTISTISNFMTTSDKVLTEATTYCDLGAMLESETKLDFDSVKTGIGGFVGTIDSASMQNMEKNDRNIIINAMHKADIEAELGINVGAVYGAYQYGNAITMSEGDEESNRVLATPYIYGNPYIDGDILVDGAYNIGGIVGLINEGGNDGYYKLNNTEIFGANGEVLLQSRLSGMYVGGLIGKTFANKIADIYINNAAANTLKIYINSNSSYYVGGLIGNASVSGNTDIMGSVYGDILYKKDSDNLYNFGAFIGLLKVGYDDSCRGFDIKVDGPRNDDNVLINSHSYPFTINTIQNSNYYDGESKFSSEEVNYDINLYAQAYYVNLDRFQIIASQNTDYHGTEVTNPFDEESKGWARDYTTVKMIQRCIPADKNTEDNPYWDSIATIYDAENVKNVSVNNNRTTNVTDDFIDHTVYEYEEGKLMLYTSDGVCVPAINPESGSYISWSEWNSSDPVTKKNVLVGMGYPTSDMVFDSDYKSYKGYLAEDILGISYYNNKVKKNSGGMPTGYVCAKEGHYKSDSVTFINTMPYIDNYKSNSGSIFEVVGKINGPIEYGVDGHDGWDYFWMGLGILAAVVVTIVGVALTIYTGGTTFPYAIFVIQYAFRGVLAYGAVILGVGAIGVASTVGVTISMAVQDKEIALRGSYDLYNTSYYQSAGVKASAYNRVIKFDEEGKVQNVTDDYKVYNGNFYQPFSFIKPLDYNKERYYVIEATGEESALKIESSSQVSTEGINFLANKSILEGTVTREVEGKDETVSCKYVVYNEIPYVVIDKYVYSEGLYWINMLESKTESYKTNELFDPSEFKSQALYHIDDDGEVYIYGEYNTDAGYNYISHNGNNLVHKDMDGDGIKEYNIVYESYDGTTNVRKNVDSYAVKKPKLDFVWSETGSAEGVIGYEYIQGGMYYAAKSKNDYWDENNVYAYATFELLDAGETPVGEHKIHYVTRSYIEYIIDDVNGIYYLLEDGSYSTTKPDGYDGHKYKKVSSTLYYQLKNEAFTATGSEVEGVFTEKYETIQVKVYPYSFTSPYNPGDYPLITPDNRIYVYQPKVDDNIPSFKKEVEYYLFVGDYKVRFKSPTDNYDVFTKVKNLNTTITLNDEVRPLKDLLTKWDELKDKALSGAGVVSDLFVCEDGALYQKDIHYTIKDFRVERVYSYYEELKSDDYRYNLFCSSAEHLFFTRYKYVDSTGLVYGLDGFNNIWDIVDDEGNIIGHYELLTYKVDNEFVSINNGRTTRLVESVKVSFGGIGSDGTYYPTLTEKGSENSGAGHFKAL